MWWKMTQKSGHLERCTTDHLMSQVDVCLLHTKCHLSHKIPPTWVNMQIWKLVINGEHKTGYNTKGCNHFWETILILFEEWYNCVCLIRPPVFHPFFRNLFYLARFLLWKYKKWWFTRPVHVLWYVILGRYLGMILQYFGIKLMKKFLIGRK